LAEIVIDGQVYEVVRKITLDFATRKAELEELARDLGHRMISVKFVVRVPDIPWEPLPEEWDEFVYFVTSSVILNKENWKEPAEGALKTDDEMTALFLADTLVRYTGGAWIITREEEIAGMMRTVFYVWTPGYYHYIGA